MPWGWWLLVSLIGLFGVFYIVGKLIEYMREAK